MVNKKMQVTLSVAVMSVLVGGASTARAAVEFWDPANTHTGTGSGGTGTWDNTTPNWYVSGATDTTHAVANTSTFQGTGGTVTLGAPITSAGFSALSSGYTFDLAGKTLTSNGQVNINAANTTISSSTSGGVLNLTSPAIFVVNAANASVAIGSGVTVNILSTNANQQTSGFRLNAAGTTLTINGGTLNVASTFDLSHSNVTGTLNLTSGQIAPAYGLGFDAVSGNGIVNFGGATVKLTQTLSDLFTPSQATGGAVPASLVLNDVGGGGGAVFNTNGFNLGLSRKLVHSTGNGTADGGVTKAGVGLFNLSSTANTYTGATTVTGGTLEGSSFGTGTGNAAVSVTPTVTTVSSILQLDASTALASVTNLTLTDLDGSTTATAVLNYAGTDTINTLTYAGTALPVGIYGGSGSGATNIEPWLSGTGTLTVTATPEPALLGIVGLVSVTTLRRKRRPN